MAHLTFDTFRVRAHCAAAYASAVAVAENPGRAYNPLFLYGPTGRGKTHLLCAIAHAIRSRRPGAEVLRISAAELGERFTDAIRADQVSQFRRSIASLDALLIDDLWLLADKPWMNDEIVRIVEDLLTQGVQVVLASDRAPADDPRMRRLLDRALIAEVG